MKQPRDLTPGADRLAPAPAGHPASNAAHNTPIFTIVR